MSFLELAKKRYSVRKFKPEPVAQDLIGQIITAGMLAPTGKNLQPQRILVMNTPESLTMLKSCTKCHFNAPLAFLVCYDTEDCWVRPYDGATSGEIDASIVTTHMMMAAADCGVGSTWIMHFDPKAMRETFAVPEKYEITALLVMGMPADDAAPIALHDAYDAVENLVFYNNF